MARRGRNGRNRAARACARLAATLLLAVAPRAGASAQQVPATIEWPFGAGAFSASAFARLAPDLRGDVALVQGGVLVVADALDVFSNWRLPGLAGSVDDVVTLAAAKLGKADDRDHLVVAASDGLWELREAGGTFHATLIDGASPWRGARRVLAADLDRDGDEDLLVLLASGRRLRAKLRQAGGQFADSPRKFDWTAGSDVSDFVVGEFDGEAFELELAVLDGAALRFIDGGGAQLAAHASLRPDHDRLVLLPAGGATAADDAVAWITAASTAPGDPARHLFVATPAAIEWCDTTTLALGPGIGGEFDGEPGCDLAFVAGGESQLRVLHRATDGATPSFSFSGDGAIDWATGGDPLASGARPCAGDFGGDGLDDLVLPLGASEALLQFVGPLAATPGATAADFVHGAACAVTTPGGMKSLFSVTATWTGLSTLAASGGWQLEYLVFRADAHGGTFASKPIEHCRLPLAPPSPLDPTPDDVEIAFLVSAVTDLHCVVARLVRVDPAGKVTDQRPAIVGAISSNGSNFDGLALEKLWPIPGWKKPEDVLSCGSTSGGRIADFIRIRRMPTGAPKPPVKPAPGDCDPPGG
ncbi:MAG: hypothetical protein FJ293_15585 [Planctomycetes bacterium]|nr:hypothetical protein [Planctomycetota bacterium]